ncbi:MAG: hypothetical protein JWM11_4799 [Planctomycetaceae bacterium]|nr:hypothetical protein [Planctomycetaceae bacterium]
MALFCGARGVISGSWAASQSLLHDVLRLEGSILRLKRFSTRWGLGAFVGLLTISLGCGRSNGVALHNVSGTLTRNGKPVPGLMVHFDPLTTKRGSTARAGADGKFTMKYDSQQNGVPPGEHKIWVEYLPANPREEMELQSGKQQYPPETQAILEKYGSAAVTPLREVVKADQRSLEVKLD